MMNEDAWGLIGAPMLLDNNGDAIFVYTPPSLHSRAASKATDPLHASKLYKKALEEMGAAEREGRPSRWEAFHFSSQENPYISREALNEIAGDMTAQAYRQEILAEDAESDPNALWKAEMIDPFRLTKHPDLARIVVGVDPPGGVTECGIVVAGIGWCPCKGQAEMHGFVLADRSMQGSPEAWASMVVRSYREFSADVVVAEKNYGGDMVKSTILAANGHGDVRYKEVQATRGKAVRAEPVCAKYEQGRIHHVGNFPALEAEQLSWVPGLPGQRSPNRIDGAIWAFHELLVGKKFDSGEDQKNKDLTRELLGVGSWRNPYRGDWMAG